jgi:ERCC4-type nuclease
MSILLDTREHGLISLLPEATQQQLPVGDVWILNTEGQPLLVIERKTTADFEASFIDGRYREQRTRLLAFCQEKKARALYLLEGGLDGKTHKLQKPALQKLIHRLMLRYNVAVWSTSSLADTANTLQLLASQIQEDPKVFEGEQLSYTDVMHTTKKANKDDPAAFALAALQGCPGISVKAATAIWAATGQTWSTLLATDETALANIKVGERRLGPAVAKRLTALLHAPSKVE